MSIPYLQGFSEKYARIAKKFGVSVRYGKGRNLRNFLSHPKTTLGEHRKRGVIYRIGCQAPDCEKSYFGEAERCIFERVNEHDATIRSFLRPNGKFESGHAMSHHLRYNIRQDLRSHPDLSEVTAKQRNLHVPDFRQTEIVASEPKKWIRKRKEGFFIAANSAEVLDENTSWSTNSNWCHSLKFFRRE